MRNWRLLLPVLMVLVALVGVATQMNWFGLGSPASQALQAGVPIPGGAVVGAPIQIGGPFRLTGADGHSVTDRDFLGKWMLVYFGYTSCPDTCPTALNDIANALDILGPKAADVAPVFITIDPLRDTPDIIGAYTAKFDKRLVGLTGTPEELTRVEKEFRVYASSEPHDDHGRAVLDHSSIIVIMNPQGRFADALNGDASPDIIAAKLRALDPPPGLQTQ